MVSGERLGQTNFRPGSNIRSTIVGFNRWFQSFVSIVSVVLGFSHRSRSGGWESSVFNPEASELPPLARAPTSSICGSLHGPVIV